ncbi:NADH-quinone oxidoreductase subunit NuoH [Planctomycetales bacterium ZRK34]|nr:NADH-quinone oxidoreductase subunit NuoH [Planctomycetales bacterium ZRK34]
MIVLIMHVLLIGGPAYGIYVERKIASWAQDRIGPNRVGPIGLLQPIADGLKFFMKEDYNPGNVDRNLFLLAPVLAVIPAMLAWATIPWGGTWLSPWGELSLGVADINVGVIYILAIGSLSVYGITIGAWAANNKYTFFGGIRATAQMLSYEIPMGLCVLCVLLLAGSSRPMTIVQDQIGYWWGVIPAWNIFQQPIAAVLFFICILAESNRAPFDLAEAEQELIGGFHTEYSSMKFAMFFLGEYMHMATASAFLTLLFLGGWHLPFVDYLIWGGAEPAKVNLLGVLLNLGVFIAKVFTLVGLMMWVRWTVPRFRFDQLMRLAWRGLIPITLGLLLITGVMVYLDLTGYLWLGNAALLAIVMAVLPFIPKGADVNRKVGLRGSRFSPATD